MSSCIVNDRDAPPRISVITPVYEQWNLVPHLLECLQAQDVPSADYEVILIDNGSRNFIPPSTLPNNVTIVRCEQAGSYAARNFGAASAKGDWLVFTDADCLPHPDWLSQLIGDRGEKDDCIYAGNILVKAASQKPNAVEIYDMVKGIPQEWYVRRGYAATANLAVAKSLFAKLNGFDARRFSGGDADFCRRAVAQGTRLIFVREASVDHPARSSWEELRRKARRMKGGQLLHQRSRQRLLINYLRTFLPPAIAFYSIWTQTIWPLRYRFIALCVQVRLWIVGMIEALRITFGCRAERR